MDKTKKNKQFFIRYTNAMSGNPKTRELIEQYVADPALINHILFFESVFPCYSGEIEELTAEENRVIAKLKMKCKHEGWLNGIPPTHREFETSAVVGYEIENEKIIKTWLISDQLNIMKLLGLEKEAS
ncbi:MAG: ester cyclase [Cyclobacteriaceae bacterium]|nr:ester cyclase [Cyclobacteriaceae bacterium]